MSTVFFFVLLGILTSLLILRITGFFLDQRVEQRIEKFCHFHADGVIHGLEPKAFVSQKKTAIILIHGFTDSPRIFDAIIKDLSSQYADLFVPLLPFHGRGLQEMKSFNPFLIEKYIHSFIETKSHTYQKLILVGQSLGGTILIRLAQMYHWSPERISLVLMAPAVFLSSNNWRYQLGYKIYPYFRNYWAKTQEKSNEVRSLDLVPDTLLAYYAISAVKRLQYYCQKTEKILREMTFPHTVLLAKDDNRINTNQLHEICQNPSCRLIMFQKGGHLIYRGESATRIAQYIENTISGKFTSDA